MDSSKLKSVIVNRTHQELVLRVGHQNCFTRLATIAVHGEHRVEIDVNWTYQEYSLEPANAGPELKKIQLNSDDCCEFERMTVTESGGTLHLHKVARGQIGTVDHHPATSVVANWRSHFSWPQAWPKFHQMSWINSN